MWWTWSLFSLCLYLFLYCCVFVATAFSEWPFMWRAKIYVFRMSATLCVYSYISKNRLSKLDRIFGECWLWLWLGPLRAALRYVMYRVAQNKPDYLFLFSKFCISTRKHVNYDNARAAARTLVKAVLNVSSIGCNCERQSFAKLS